MAILNTQNGQLHLRPGSIVGQPQNANVLCHKILNRKIFVLGGHQYPGNLTLIIGHASFCSDSKHWGDHLLTSVQALAHVTDEEDFEPERKSIYKSIPIALFQLASPLVQG